MDRRQFLSLVAPTVAGCGALPRRDAAGETTTATGTRTGATTPTSSHSPTPSAATPTATGTPVHAGYETTEVVVRTQGSDRLGAVTAAIADTPRLQYRGLSDTPELPDDRGMLFVFERAAERTFVMRGMEYGLDIVYAAPDRTITRIHHAPAPGPGEDGAEQRYPGTGQYVLEVSLGWTTDRGVTAGDVLAFDL